MSVVDEKNGPSAASSVENVIEVTGTQSGVRRIEAIQSASRVHVTRSTALTRLV